MRGDVRLLSVATYDHFALFAPLRSGPWNQATLFNAQKWLGTNVGAPTDTVLSFPSLFVFSDVYFDKKTPFDTLVVTLSSGEIITLPLAVEEIVDSSPAAPDSSTLLPSATRKATALSVFASYHFTSDNMPVEFSLDTIEDDLKIVVGESSIKIDSVNRFYNTESNRFNILTKEGIDIPIDSGVSIGLTWTMGHYRSSDNKHPTSILKFDDVRFEAKIGGQWVPVASASTLEVQWNGRGTTAISPVVNTPAPATPLPLIHTTETTPLKGSLHIKVESDGHISKIARKMFDERLHEVRIISARKKDDTADFTGPISVGLFSDFDDRSVRPLSWSINVPKDSTLVVLLEIQPTATTNELIGHLMSNQLYYSQAIWRAMNPTTVGILLSRYTWHVGGGERPLVELVDPNPVAIAANYLVLRLSGDDKTEREAWLHKKKIIEGSCREDLVPVPSGGVFAEAVLGRFNSAEKLDITRFWNWQDSPIPIQAPDIAAIQAGSRSEPDNTVPGQLSAPVLSIVNPPAFPDPQGMGAVLAAIQNGNMFRDMSGLAATIGLAQAGLAGAQQGASDASTQAGKNAEVAAQLGAKVAELAAKIIAAKLTGGASLAGGASGGGQDGLINSDKGISKTGSMLNYARNMDGREVPSQSSASDGTAPSSSPGTGGGAAPTDGSGIGSTSYAATSAPPVSNEKTAYNAVLGVGSAGINLGPSGDPAKNWSLDFVWDGVDLLRQTKADNCWAAAAAMVTSWDTSTSVPINDTPVPNSIEEAATRFALEVEPPMSYSIAAFTALLEDKGPLWISANQPFITGPGFHAVVVTGIYSDEASDGKGTFLYVLDPWDRDHGSPGHPGTHLGTHNSGSHYSISWKEFSQEFETAAHVNPGWMWVRLMHSPTTHGRKPSAGASKCPIT